jgi:uncharacterized protein (TIGR03118 family)
MPVFKRLASLCSVVVLTASMASMSAVHADTMGANSYHVTRLVSDQPGHAMHTDPNLVNAWGLTAGPTTPWWVSDNGTDVSTLYDGTGNAIPLIVDVAGAPTGAVFNGTPAFVVKHAGFHGPAVFAFATESGTIRGWNPNVPPPAFSTQSFVLKDRSFAGAVYKGLATAISTDGPLLYATDFHNGRVDVFDAHMDRVLVNSFKDPNMPAGFAPFGIQTLGNSVFVTYAEQVPGSDDEAHGPGLGFVDRFGLKGQFLGRVASRHALDAPWGLAWAPSDFGRFSEDLLVGNFGDGRIIAYEPESDGHFAKVGVLRRADGTAIRIDGLWALRFGNGAAAGPTNSLFFTAGPDDESHGLFGMIDANEPTP